MVARQLKFDEALNDAGLLREYLRDNYGFVLHSRKRSSVDYQLGEYVASRLARLIGSTTDQVVNQAIRDYEISQGLTEADENGN